MTTQARPPKDRSRTYVPHCPRCDARWTQMAACHCSGCHLTFGCASAFDRHRRHSACRNPVEAGLIDRDGLWGWPGTDPRGRLRDDR